MKYIPFILIDIALAFAAFTFYVLWKMGAGPAFATMGQDLATMQMTGDILLGLGSAVALMIMDARKNGINAAPYVAATFFLGAPGPLFYLARRLWPLRKA